MHRLALATLFLLLALFLADRPALAAECPQSNAMDTPVWDNFQRFVRSEYIKGRRFSSRDIAYIYGHALGRAAAAVRQVPLREQAFACIDRGLDQAGHADFGSRGSARLFYRLAQEAAMGMHDARVAEVTGVTSNAPAPEVYGASAPPPRAGRNARRVSASGAQRSPRSYDCDRIDGTLQYQITGEMIYGAGDPRAARTEPTSVTLVGNAMLEFEPGDAASSLRSNPENVGRRYVLWMEDGRWRFAFDRTPSLQCGEGNASAGGESPPQGVHPCANDNVRRTGRARYSNTINDFTVKNEFVCTGRGYTRITESALERWSCETSERTNCTRRSVFPIVGRETRNGRRIIRFQTDDGREWMSIEPLG